MTVLHQTTAIALKEFRLLLKDREALALLFAMPVFFILVMSYALEGVFEAGSAEHPIEVLLVNKDTGPVAGQIAEGLLSVEGLRVVEQIRGKTVTREMAGHLVSQGANPMALIFEADFSESVSRYVTSESSEPARVLLLVDAATNRQLIAPIKSAVQAMAERRIAISRQRYRIQTRLSTLGVADMQSLTGAEFPADQDPPSINLEIVSPQETTAVRPRATEQNVPAYTIFGVFFIVLPLASGFMRERHEGTFLRIIAAPIAKSTLLLGKLLPYYVVNLIQIGLMFSVGVLLFGIHLGQLGALALVSLALAACANGLGLMVAALGRTEAQIGAMGVFFAVVLSALGGLMVPTFVMPPFMKTLSLLTPHAWALAGYHDVMLRGLGVAQIWKATAMLIAFAALFYLVALWRFKFID